MTDAEALPTLKSTIFIGGLPSTFSNDNLKEQFGKFGETKDAFVSYRGKRHRGFAFVEYSEESSAQAAIKEMSGKEVAEGKPINVQLARERPEKPKKAPKAKKPKAEKAEKPDATPKEDLPLTKSGLFIGGLPKSYTTANLTEDFAKFGELADSFVSYRGKRHRGFGFVEYKEEKSAEKALKEMAGKTVGEEKKEINVQLARQRPEKTKKPKPKKPKAEGAKEAKAEPVPKEDLPLMKTGLFIGGLPKSYTTEQLTKDFESFGELTDSFVSYRGKRHRGFGFAMYKEESSAEKAMKDMAGKTVGDEKKEINVQFAQQRPEKTKKAKAPAKAAAAPAKKEKKEPKPKRVVDENAPLSETMLFVGGLPKTYLNEHLEKDFAKFGKLKDHFVSFRGKHHRGFGFVDYEEKSSADKALKEMAGKVVEGSKEGKPISVTAAREKPAKEEEATKEL